MRRNELKNIKSKEFAKTLTALWKNMATPVGLGWCYCFPQAISVYVFML